MHIPDQKFYDKVAKRFGGYKSEAIYQSNFPYGNPEEIFLEELTKYNGKDRVALDIGCADGRFTLQAAKKFHKILGIDISSELLAKANQLKEELKVSNVTFQEANAERLPFQDKYFDLIYSRRGPSPYTEISRVTKQAGYYLEICIGEKDAKELKEIFRRGQGFNEWDNPVSKTKTDNLNTYGFNTIFVEDYFYSEIYPDIENLDLFLQGVPIFKDFDSEKDRDSLFSYTKKMRGAGGIELRRHRVVIVARKS